MQKQQLRENKMKKATLGTERTAFCHDHFCAGKTRNCVFDLLGKAGESYKLIEEGSLYQKLGRVTLS